MAVVARRSEVVAVIPPHLAEAVGRPFAPRGLELAGRVEGRLKEVPEDFVVDEIPAYEPCGEGEHLFVRIEKRDLAWNDARRAIAAALGIRPDDVSAAGIKDRRAVTRQWISVPRACEPRLPQLDRVDGLRVLDARAHANRLRTGHLRGNRFDVLVRCEMDDAAWQRLQRATAALEQGVPNAFGAQRFGRGGSTLAAGFEALRASAAGRARRRRSRMMRRLALSAVQAALFNDWLARRARDESLWRAVQGDLLRPVGSKAFFVCEDPATDQARLERGEVCPTGPLYGPRMPWPRGATRRVEEDVLHDAQLDVDAFAAWGRLARGGRRAGLVVPQDFAMARERGGVRVRFSLPAGSYATVVLEALFRIA